MKGEIIHTAEPITVEDEAIGRAFMASVMRQLAEQIDNGLVLYAQCYKDRLLDAGGQTGEDVYIFKISTSVKVETSVPERLKDLWGEIL